MLTNSEWEQLQVAFDCMYGINIVGKGTMVSLHNVKAIVQRWTEEYHRGEVVGKEPVVSNSEG